MKFRFHPSRLLLAFPLMIMLLATACKTNNCQDEVCAPCPSSKLVVEYQDTAGNCISPMSPAGHVVASMAGDTLYTYDFVDSCHVNFIIEKGVMYHVTAGSMLNETIEILDFKYQEPVWQTDCCPCYPADSVMVMMGSDSSLVTYPLGSYENDPVIRVVQ